MSIVDVRELVRIAKRDEDVGADFYQALAENIEDSKLRDEILEIREEELKHSRRFEEMLDQLGEYVTTEEFPGQYEEYYNNFLSRREHLESDEAIRKAGEVKDDIEALKLALNQEKDTLLFYLELKELVKPYQHQDMVHEVIDEERDHIVRLSRILLERM